MKMWLCEIPQGEASNVTAYTMEEDRLKASKQEHNDREYQQYRKRRTDQGYDARERDEYEEKTKRLARRKHNRYCMHEIGWEAGRTCREAWRE